MRIAPVVMKWCEVEAVDPETGAIERTLGMVPVVRYRNVAKRAYHLGAEYPLVIQETRSRAAHNRYFAALNEAFDNLPEGIAARWQNFDHFRKWLLIESGWYTEKEFAFHGRTAKRDAHRLSTFIRTDTEEEYLRIWVTEVNPTLYKVIVRRAKSQDHQHMDKQAFKESSDAVLELASHFIQVPKGKLLKNAGRAA